MLKLHINATAQRGLDKIWDDSVEKWGLEGALEYEELIDRATLDLRHDPDRAGTKTLKQSENKEIPALKAYAITLSKKRAGSKIGKPKHSILYFTIQNETLVVGGVASFAQQRRIDGMRPQDMFEDAQKTLTKVK